MNRCQNYNLTIKRMANLGRGGNMPREYQQVEYLQSTGAQIIDTGIAPAQGVKTSIQFELASGFTYSNASFLFGSYISPQGYSAALPSSTTIRTGTGRDGEFTNVTTSAISTSSVNEITYRYGEITVNSQTVYTGSTGVNNSTIYLYGRHHTNVNYTSHLRIYHAQIGTSSNASQYRDLYPCYRKADNVTGMFDLINSEFIPYTGTANFITGNNV